MQHNSPSKLTQIPFVLDIENYYENRRKLTKNNNQLQKKHNEEKEQTIHTNLFLFDMSHMYKKNIHFTSNLQWIIALL